MQKNPPADWADHIEAAVAGLRRARLFGRMQDGAGTLKYPEAWISPQADLAKARRLIGKHGYGRRKEELEDAERAIPHSSGGG